MTYTFSTTLVPGSLTVYKDGDFFATFPGSMLIVRQAIHYTHLICGRTDLHIYPGEIAGAETIEAITQTLNALLPVGDIIQLAVELTAEQVKSIFSTPQQLIPAPGAGKIIDVISVVGEMGEGEEVFETTTLYVYTDTLDTPQNAFMFQDVNLLQLGYNGGKIKFVPNSTGSNFITNLIENKGILLKGDADSGSGASTMTIHIAYRIINL